MKTIEYWKKHLDLKPHPEGGFYHEPHRNTFKVDKEKLPGNYSSDPDLVTTCHFLLPKGDVSLFHRIPSNEIWHHLGGESLVVVELTEEGLKETRLGPNVDEGEKLEYVVPGGVWFGAFIPDDSSYALVNCICAPAFDFADFEIATRDQLLAKFPNHKEVIEKLTKE